MSLTNEQVESIIEAHTDTVDALKKERDEYKAKAAEADKLKKQIEDMDGEGYKERYEKAIEEFDAYKADIESEKAKAEKSGLYRDLLKKAGVDDKRIGSIMKVTDVSELVVNKDGTLRDADNLIERVKDEWSDFIVETTIEGDKPATPPSNLGGGMTKEQIMSIKDTRERQAAIAESLESGDGVF